MFPAELPAGADTAAASREAAFSATTAARLAGLGRSALRRWEEVLRHEADFGLGERLSLADVVALAALGVTARCLGAGAEDYAAGHARLFEALRNRADVERLDAFAALVGRDSARIAERYDEARCAAEDILVIPLRPILAGLRDQVFV
jgi:hypothetical protein